MGISFLREMRQSCYSLGGSERLCTARGRSTNYFGNLQQSDNALSPLQKDSNDIILSMNCIRPEKVDFVRMAGLLDAIIVPFSSVGIAESVNIFFDKSGIMA